MKFYVFALFLFLNVSFSFAIGGGGGSGDFSSFGGFGDSYSSWVGFSGSDIFGASSYGSYTSNQDKPFVDLLCIVISLVVIIFAKKPFNINSGKIDLRITGLNENELRVKTNSGKIALRISNWNETELRERVTLVFYSFQKAWSENDLNALKLYVSSNFYEQIWMEMSVLSGLKRENRIYDLELKEVVFKDTYDDNDNTKDCFRVFIKASAKDVLYDVENNKELFSHSLTFSEMWTFNMDAGFWKLDGINQASDKLDESSQTFFDFARAHSFYYNPDFGSLMIPSDGVLFSDIDFGKVDINNHVIGKYRNAVIEFYSAIFNKSESYLICQAALPTAYGNILVRKKNSTYRVSSALKALRKIEMESPEFNAVFDVYFSKSEGNTTFELLNPLFMEYIRRLPFDISIEIVGNSLYLYTNDFVNTDYQRLLDVLSVSFDEMKH